ncbi:uncharacterized protein BDV14DRAFT_195883 [Aspergillus stella-maris]|uniref:uncharacterized protein n=1 Tax=Aspergillus stella-maris TaxID=1810926 RepID=UPI003CCCA4B6
MYTSLLLPISILPLATAICPGYNYAFFNPGDGWVYTSNTACGVAWSGNCDNICTCGGWGCSPSGSVDSVKVNGLWYACRNDANKGSCGPENGFEPPPQLAGKTPESCCRNDGNRNLQEGIIGRRQAGAIAETNGILDRHAEEVGGVSGRDLVSLRERHEMESSEAVKREAEAAELDRV